MTIESGTELTCTDEDCDCSLTVQQPCTKGGDSYTCGCGSALVPADAVPEKSGVVRAD